MRKSSTFQGLQPAAQARLLGGLLTVLILALVAAGCAPSAAAPAPAPASQSTTVPSTSAPAATQAAPASGPTAAAPPNSAPASGGGYGGSTGATAAPTAAAAPASGGGQSASVTISNSAFGPKALTVAVGATVMWINQDSIAHTVTADNASFDSGNQNQGATFKFTFTKPGTYAYYCRYHGGPGGAGMSGQIIVK